MQAEFNQMIFCLVECQTSGLLPKMLALNNYSLLPLAKQEFCKSLFCLVVLVIAGVILGLQSSVQPGQHNIARLV